MAKYHGSVETLAESGFRTGVRAGASRSPAALNLMSRLRVLRRSDQLCAASDRSCHASMTCSTSASVAGQQLVVARMNVPQVSAHREVDGIRIEPLRR